MALSTLATVLMMSACSWLSKLAPKHLSEAERREAALRISEAIQRAGGNQIWIKGASSGAIPAGRANVPVEVVTVPSMFDAVLSAVRAEFAQEGYEARVRRTTTRGRRRVADIHVFERGEPACQWRLREVGTLGRAAIIIDDLGQSADAARRLVQLPYPLTFSVLPRLRYSAETAEEAHRAGREVMLHLPMEPETGAPAGPGPGAIRVGMSSGEVAQIVDTDLASVPHAAGVNNHMGSRATADTALMAEVMKDLAPRHLYFIDSRTTSATVALDEARRAGIPAFFRSVFLDDNESVPYTLQQLRKLRQVVEAQGAALAIGHPYPSTIAALAQFLPQLERDDIQLVAASQLIDLPEVARLSPPRRPAL